APGTGRPRPPSGFSGRKPENGVGKPGHGRAPALPSAATRAPAARRGALARGLPSEGVPAPSAPGTARPRPPSGFSDGNPRAPPGPPRPDGRSESDAVGAPGRPPLGAFRFRRRSGTVRADPDRPPISDPSFPTV